MPRLGVLAVVALAVPVFAPATLRPRAAAFFLTSAFVPHPPGGGVPIIAFHDHLHGRHGSGPPEQPPGGGGFAAAPKPASGGTASVLVVAAAVGSVLAARHRRSAV
jgi:hypothetical protein